MKMIRRWQTAQRQEKAYYDRRNRFVAVDRDRIVRAVEADPLRQKRILQRTGLAPEDYRELSVLEIGGYRFADLDLHGVSARYKLVMDPLLWLTVSDDCQYIKGLGERIPLKPGSIDVCCVLNTIDHCSDPDAVLREVRRVLAGNGCMVISCNVFSPWARPFFPLLNRVDGPHPWHFTRSTFLELVHGAGFESTGELGSIRPSVKGWRRPLTTLKVLVARMAGLNHVRLRCYPAISRRECQWMD